MTEKNEFTTVSRSSKNCYSGKNDFLMFAIKG